MPRTTLRNDRRLNTRKSTTARRAKLSRRRALCHGLEKLEAREVMASVSFQQGVASYTGAVDVQLSESAPDTVFPQGSDGGNTALLVDWTDAGTPNAGQTLLRFDNIFGSGTGQIPLGATIVSARVQVYTNNAGAGGKMHRMLVPWDGAAATWNSMSGGIQTDDVEATSTYSGQAGSELLTPNVAASLLHNIDVRNDLQAWSNGATNYGWAVMPWTNGTDGWAFVPSEGATAAQRPKLFVDWIAAGSQQVASFQEGTGGYSGTFDTQIKKDTPDVDNSSASTILIDWPDAAPAINDAQGLLRFENLFGFGPGQVPVGATISAAYLTLSGTTGNAEGDGGRFYRMLQPWTETDTWNTRVNGLQTDGVEAAATFNAQAGLAARTPNIERGYNSFDVTADVQAWATGATNNGWAIIPWTSGTDGWIFNTSETTIAAERPRLRVFYTPPAPPVNAMLDVVSGVLAYTSGADKDNQVSLSLTGGNYSFTDPIEAITLGAGAIAAGWTGNGTNTVTGPSSSVNSLNVLTGTGADNVTVNGVDDPITFVGGGQTGDVLSIPNGLLLPAADVIVNGFQSIAMPANATIDLGTGKLTLLVAGGVGTIASPFKTHVGELVAIATQGDVIIREQDGAKITVDVAGAGNIVVESTSGTLDVSGTIATDSGNITLRSADAISVNAAIGDAQTTGTILIEANTDGAGAQGYTQATSAAIGTNNNTADAVRIDVNTAGGGSGDAILSVGLTLGTYSVNANAGSILWNSGFTIPAFNGSNTLTLRAKDYVFATSGAAGSIGTFASPIQTDNLSDSSTATMTAGAGGIYLTDWGGLDLIVANATATGAGSIQLVSANAGGHNLFIRGPVTTGSGNILLQADDDLYLEGPIGGGGFSGTVTARGNLDGGNEQEIFLQGGGRIETTNTTASAVLLEVFPSTNATGTAIGGITLDGNVTVGNGGTITLDAAAGVNPAATRTGRIFVNSGVLDAGTSGTVVLRTRGYYIGDSFKAVTVNAGTVLASTSAPATFSRTDEPNIYVVAQHAATFKATTTSLPAAPPTNNSPLPGTIDLRTLSGVLTIGGATNGDLGPILIRGADGVVVNGVLGDANTTGDITVTAVSGEIVINSDLTIGNFTVNLNEAGEAELGPTTTVNGTLNAGNGVQVGPGETLSGTGTVNGAVSVLTGGIVSPGGANSGRLTTGGLTFASTTAAANIINRSTGLGGTFTAIDFSGSSLTAGNRTPGIDTAGDIVTNQFAAQGITFGGSGVYLQQFLPALDPVSVGFTGHYLANRPRLDSAATAGVINLTFANPVSAAAFAALDSSNDDFVFRAYLGSNPTPVAQFTSKIPVPGQGYFGFDGGTSYTFDRIEITPTVNTSLLAIDSLQFKAASVTGGASQFVAGVFGPSPGTSYDQLVTSGTVTLGGATLTMSINAGEKIGDKYLLIRNDSGTAVGGKFAQGNAITVGTTTLSINYAGGDGNDVELTVTAASTPNTAPILDSAGDMSLPTLVQNQINSTGIMITALIASAGGNRITDSDASDPEGIAIIAANTTSGTVEYSLNGTTWQSIGSVSPANARLLAADGTTRVRFVPNSGFSGAISDLLTFRAWDQSQGSNGGVGDASTGGGTTPFSTATETASIVVTPPDPIYISEVMFNAPGSDSGREYIELRGTPGATIPQGTYFIAIEGDNAGAGTLHHRIDLGGLQFGANGFLVLRQAQSGTQYTIDPQATDVVSSDITWPNLPNGRYTAENNAADMEQASNTFMVITTAVPPALSTDLDADNNGLLDPATIAGWTILDGVGILNNDAAAPADLVYGLINFRQTAGTGIVASGTEVTYSFTTIGYVARRGNSTGSTAADWLGATDGLLGTFPVLTLPTTTTQLTVPELAGAALNHLGSTNFVVAPNVAPVNTVPATAATNEDTNLAFTGASLLSIADADAGAAAVRTTVSLPTGVGVLTATATGGATITGGGTNSVQIDGTITAINQTLATLVYQPLANFNGSTTLTVLTTDLGNTGSGGAKTDSDNVAITVNPINDAPTFTLATNPPSVAQDVGAQTVTNFVTAISAGPTDEASQTLTFQLTSTGTTGGLTFSAPPAINSSTGALTYTASAGSSGTATFDVVLVDNGSGTAPNVNTSVTRSFTITITAAAVVNQPPVNTVPSTVSTNEDANLAFTSGSLLTIADPDAGASPVRTTVSLPSGVGVLNATATGGATITGGGTNSMQIDGTITAINQTLATLVYQPLANFNGSTTLTVLTSDLGNTGTGGAKTDSDNVAITVNPVNDAPTFTLSASPPTVVQDAGIQTVTNFVTAISAGPPDEASQTLTFQLASTGTTGGLTFSTPPAINSSTGALTYTAGAGSSGTATFNVVLVDSGSGTAPNVNASIARSFTITVTAAPVNQAPVNTVPTTASTNEDANLAFTGASLISIADADAGSFPVRTTVSLPSGVGVLAATATSGATITGGGTNNVQIDGTITAINQTLATLVYQPLANFNGSTTLTVLTSDLGNTGTGGAKTDSDNVTITVNAVNDVPSFMLGGNPPAINEDAGAQLINNFATVISRGPSDESGQSLTFNMTVTGTTGSLSFATPPTINPATGALTYAVAANTSGTATVSVTLSDNGSGSAPNVNTSAAQTFTITVNPVNDAPSFGLAGNPPASQENAGSQTVPSFATSISRGPADESAQTLAFGLNVTSSTGNLTFSAPPTIDPTTGTLTYTATANTFGTATISVLLTDSGSNNSPNVNVSAAQTFTITVTQLVVNQPPVNTSPSTATTNEDTPLPFTGANAISIADSDAGSASVSTTLTLPTGVGLLGLTAQGGAIITGNSSSSVQIDGPVAAINQTLATLVYTPVANYNGNTTLTIVTNDLGNTGAGGAKSDTDNITINVAPINDAPSFGIAGDPPTVTFGITTQSIPNFATNISAGPTDEASQTLTFIVTVTGTTGNLAFATSPAINPTTGTLTYTLQSNTSGTATLSVRLVDSGSNIAPNANTSPASTFTIRTTAPITGPVYVVDNVLHVDGSISSDRIILQGGAGGVSVRLNNRLYGSYSAASIVIQGEGGADTITATNVLVPMEVYGGEGDDYITTGSGNDFIDGGEGRDRLYGGAGSDEIRGGMGADTLYGGASNDFLYGEEDNDTIHGEAGNDVLDGGDGSDTINGGDGQDIARGQGGNDTLDGGNGNDILLGGLGSDRLYGRAGRDFLIGGASLDTLYGGNDADLLVGDSTLLDDDDALLMAVLFDWTTGPSFASRVAAVESSLAGGLEDDFSSDSLYGEGDYDLFAILSLDVAKDRKSGDLVRAI